MSGFLTPFQASEITSPLTTPIKKQQEITMAASVSFVNLTAYWFTIQDRQGNIISHIAPNSSGADNFPEVIRDMVIINRDTSLTLQDNGNEANIFRIRFNNQAASEGISNNASITNNLVTLASGLPAGSNDIGKVHLLDATGNPIGADGQHNLLVGLRSSSGVEPIISSYQVDGTASSDNGLLTESRLQLFNETSWDRQRGNTQGTLLASAARTASLFSPNQTNYNARGVILYLNITAFGGTSPSLVPSINTIDPVSGLTGGLYNFTAITATGFYMYLLYPGVSTTGNFTAVVNQSLPRAWNAGFNISGTTPSFTFSMGYSMIL